MMRNLMKAEPAEQIQDDFAEAVLTGLGQENKSIPCAYLYDDRGSFLFERITETEEYYPTRTEIGLLEDHADEIAGLTGAGSSLVEFGSGSSRKTKILIDALPELEAYVPIDISDGALSEAEEKLSISYPDLRVVPLHADFNQPMYLPAEAKNDPRLGFFPGSTIGNFTRDGARGFLKRAADFLESGNSLVIGVDLKKDTDTLEAAYNDADGVTAEFNLNLLDRINRELGGDFDRSQFAHRATYNEREGRVEIYIESLERQSVSIFDFQYEFEAGELIHTENSHKYSVDEFTSLAAEAGWGGESVWVDEGQMFSVHYLRAA